jgi:hypothetical protein
VSALCVEVADGGGADEATLQVVVAAVEALLRTQREPPAVPNRWRFSGREWASGPVRRARP